MPKRANYLKVSPELIEAYSGAAKTLESSSIEPKLRYLIELRVSQINGCAYCVGLHTRQLREEGEDQKRLDTLVVWHEVPHFDDRERAALEWTEAVTRIEASRVPDSLYEKVIEYLSEKEIVDLTFVVANMNLWNRIAISFR